jgi:hypothetical protein
MKSIFKLATFALSFTFFSQVNALPGDFCPEEKALRTTILNNLVPLASHQNLTLKIPDRNGQERNWKVSDAQFYPNVGIGVNALPLQEGDLLIRTLGDIVTQNRIAMDYDMATVTEDDQKIFDLREQERTWCLIQFPHSGSTLNAFVFRLSQPEAQ